MAHPLVAQLRFTRSELQRCLEGVSESDAAVRMLPMNCISWIVGHLATQENAYWVYYAQGEKLLPDLRGQVGTGQPASIPHYGDMLEAWRTVTAAADRYLDTISGADLARRMERNGKVNPESIGQLLLRNIYHYWFHTGEAYAIRQLLGHTDLPQFVGNLPDFGGGES